MGEACLFPRCKGYDWTARSTGTHAFDVAVLAHMRHTGAPFNKAVVAVYDAARHDPRECMLS